MTKADIEEILLKIQSLIEQTEWSHAIEQLAKLAVYCNNMYRKTENQIWDMETD